MKRRLVTLAIPFAHETKEARLVETMRSACEELGLHGEPAKMGPHATIIPPFYCTEREMKGMAILSHLTWKWNGGQTEAHAYAIDVFEPPTQDSDVGAIYIALDIDAEYRRYVERHKINWPFPFKYPPARRSPSDRIWIPHLSVIEAPGLHNAVRGKKAKLGRKLGAISAHDRLISFGEPLLFERVVRGEEKRWEQVLV
jgi:hypothetical protein